MAKRWWYFIYIIDYCKSIVGCDGILCTLCNKIDKKVIDNAGSKLKCVSTFSVGFDHIDIDYCKEKNISVGYTPGVLAKTTAETAVALSFCASRLILPAIDSAREGTWGSFTPLGYCGKDIYGSTVGVIGMGSIGYEYAKMMKGLGCNIIYSSRNRKEEIEKELNAKYMSMEEVLKNADIVSLHCSYNKDTHHLINKDTLKLMKKDAIIINTSRGGVIDQDALIESIKAGNIYSVGLDVTTPEPLPTSSELFKYLYILIDYLML